MSVIIYKEGKMIGDRMTTIHGYKVGTKKVRRIVHNDSILLVGTVGDCNYEAPFLEWLCDGLIEKPQFEEDRFTAIVASLKEPDHSDDYDNVSIRVFFHDLYPLCLDGDEPIAIGCAAIGAMVALEFTKNIIQVVDAISRIDPNVGMGWDLISFHESETSESCGVPRRGIS